MRISDWSSDVCSSDLPKETAGPWTLKQVQGDEIRNVVFRPLAVIPRKEKARAEARASPPWQAGRSSEWQPVLLLAKFHIADVGAEPRADADADRAEHHIVAAQVRSEEHTSELQSLMRNSYAVFCLKKKIIQ